MDWNNIDFNSSYERGQDFLSGYNFETVILEVLCNMRTEDINPNSVMQHINKVINNSAREAREIAYANVKQLTEQILKEREE